MRRVLKWFGVVLIAIFGVCFIFDFLMGKKKYNLDEYEDDDFDDFSEEDCYDFL